MALDLSKFNHLTVEPAKYDNGVSVYGYGTYGPTSVLAGQTKKQYLDGFDSVEEALEAYPTAEVGGGYTPYNDAGANPPSWFDPAYAGEHWDSDY